MLQGLLDQPEDFLAHIRRYTFSLSTQIIFGYRAPDTQDPNLLQLFSVSSECESRMSARSTDNVFVQSFERWGKLAGSASAQLADLFPIIQSLPRALSPNIGYAEMLHKKEKDLYVRLWMRAKNALESGKGTVRSPGADIIGVYLSMRLLADNSCSHASATIYFEPRRRRNSMMIKQHTSVARY